LYQCVLALSPAKAEPLLAAVETKAYRISVKPCGPLLFRLLRAPFERTDMAVRVRMTSGKIST